MVLEIWSCVNKYDRFKVDVYQSGVIFYFISQGRHLCGFGNNLKSMFWQDDMNL
jgi:hypothetical protein